MARLTLHPGDWIVIAAYLVFATLVGLKVREKAKSGRESYFLAGRSLPWWWAGLSIAATTFAADTPLAVTGIVADRGLSGNWMWLSWVGVHAAAFVYFATRWRRSRVVTDAELVSLRYAGRPATALRWSRSLLFGVVYNCLILAWVLRAMVKIVTPFFHWDVWLPSLTSALTTVWPQASGLGTPSEAMTIVALITIVGFYSSLGGIRGVVFTDLVQLTIALFASVWFAVEAWVHVGGRTALVTRLSSLYGGGEADEYLALFPSTDSGWLTSVGIGAFAFGAYLIVQSYANIPADGGGYLMQRLGSTKTPDDARRASGLFIAVQYVVRSFPWLVVAVCALVLIPIGQESTALDGTAAAVGDDRELAYPVLMVHLLPPIILGLLVTSLLAAFMSTVDTHLNWGSSYIVNDVFLSLRPDASDRAQVTVARVSVVSFAVVAVLISFQIETIEQAWKWVAALGAALGIPTALRWLWWRVNAAGELCAMVVGLATAAVLTFATSMPYEVRLVAISGASAAGLLFGMFVFAAEPRDHLRDFTQLVDPVGFWPSRSAKEAIRGLTAIGARWAGVVGAVVLAIAAIHRALFLGAWTTSAALAVLAAALGWFAGRRA